MAGAVLGLSADDETIVPAADIATSFPTFAETLAALGAPIVTRSLALAASRRRRRRAGATQTSTSWALAERREEVDEVRAVGARRSR